MSYKETLILAGANLYDFIELGDYSGTWYALLSYKGQIGLVQGSYGSCNGCDAFQSEFECYGYDEIDDLEKKINFGKDYLLNIIPIEDAIKDVEKYVSWDMEAPKLLDWLNKSQELIHSAKFQKRIKEYIE